MLKNTDYFRAIVQTRSISKAAQSLFISQPALSMYLSNLEKTLGIKLFDRSKTPLELTRAGKLYYDYALRYEGLVSQMHRDFDTFVGKENGHLRIGISHWVSLFFASRVLPLFFKQYPLVEIELLQTNTHTLEQTTRAKKLDFFISHTAVLEPGIVYDILGKERILMFCSSESNFAKDHPTCFENPANIDIHELSDQPILCNEPNQVLRQAVDNIFAKHNIQPYYRVTATSTLTLVELAAEGFGCAFVPEYGQYFPKDLRRLSVYTVDDPILSWNLCAGYSHGMEPSALGQDFIQLTKDILRAGVDLFDLH